MELAFLFFSLALCLLTNASPSGYHKKGHLVSRKVLNTLRQSDAAEDLVSQIQSYMGETKTSIEDLRTTTVDLQRQIVDLQGNFNDLDGVNVFNLAQMANISMSSRLQAPLSNIIDNKYIQTDSTNLFDVCIHTKESSTAPWINFEFSERRFVKEVIIFNRQGCCRERLFPFDLILTDEKGVSRKCQGKSFDVGDPEISSKEQIKVKIECDEFAKSVKLVGLHSKKLLNICEMIIIGF